MISRLRGEKPKTDESPSHVVLKLLTGENVVGRLNSILEDGFVLEYPMIINFSYDEEAARTRIYLTSLNPFSTQRSLYTLNKKHVIFVSIIDDDVIDFYEKNVTVKFKSFDPEDDDMDYLESLEVTSNTMIH
jgi:hypothetical protein